MARLRKCRNCGGQRELRDGVCSNSCRIWLKIKYERAKKLMEKQLKQRYGI